MKSSTVITKNDLKQMLKGLATKKDLTRFATKKDLKRFATKKDLKKDLAKFAARIDEKIRDSVEILRVLIESVQADVKFLMEVRVPHEEKLQTHDKILDNHEKRITTVEDYAYLKDKLKSKQTEV